LDHFSKKPVFYNIIQQLTDFNEQTIDDSLRCRIIAKESTESLETISKNTFFVAATDGGCLLDHKKAVAAWGDESHQYASMSVEEDPTNIWAELHAIEQTLLFMLLLAPPDPEGVEKRPPKKRVNTGRKAIIIFTDSLVSINLITSKIKRFNYIPLLRKIDQIISKLFTFVSDIVFYHVYSHRNIGFALNETMDKEAGKILKKATEKTDSPSTDDHYTPATDNHVKCKPDCVYEEPCQECLWNQDAQDYLGHLTRAPWTPDSMNHNHIQNT